LRGPYATSPWAVYRSRCIQAWLIVDVIHRYAFDLLWLDGVDLRPQPLLTRNRRLKLLLGRQPTGVVRYADAVAVDGCALFAEVCRRDMEGIVAKWAVAPYGLLDGRSSW